MKALICGVSGQDGGYLARLLLEEGYEVIGTSRDAMVASFATLERLGISDQVTTVSMAINDFRSVLSTLEKHQPDEIYNLAGQTSVSLSFEQPLETMESIAGGTLNLLEAIRCIARPMRLYSAGSSECYGDTAEPANEETPFRPRSPYAVAKASAHWLVRNYREAYNLFACTGILFNHESPQRQARFVTQKIVTTAHQIALGKQQKLRLGNILIQRDWGWAPDYAEAMWRMLRMKQPEDLVIATGRTVSLEYFIAKVFENFSLNWQDHVNIDPSLFRPTDIQCSRADPTKAFQVLGWRHQVDIDEVITRMCNAARGKTWKPMLVQGSVREDRSMSETR
ncbi:MAG: GDP-mannose 4,6-dehydratase [Betaproteobacteria bacterium]|nr:GDP-mannose 4,6-dehydratase [Betaproteobacteria bacterium]